MLKVGRIISRYLPVLFLVTVVVWLYFIKPTSPSGHYEGRGACAIPPINSKGGFPEYPGAAAFMCFLNMLTFWRIEPAYGQAGFNGTGALSLGNITAFGYSPNIPFVGQGQLSIDQQERLINESGIFLVNESGNRLCTGIGQGLSLSGTGGLSASFFGSGDTPGASLNLTASGIGWFGFPGSGQLLLSGLLSSGAGQIPFLGSGACSISSLIANGTGFGTPMSGTGEPVIAAFQAQGTGLFFTVNGTGQLNLTALSASATGEEILFSGSGGGAITNNFIAAGVGLQSAYTPGSGAAVLSGIGAVATGKIPFVGSGSIGINQLICSGATTLPPILGSGSCILEHLEAEGKGYRDWRESPIPVGPGGGSQKPIYPPKPITPMPPPHG